MIKTAIIRLAFFLLCLLAFNPKVYAQDIAMVKAYTSEAETLIAGEDYSGAIAKLKKVREIMGSLEGKPLELYNTANEGLKRQREEAQRRENLARYEKLMKEGDDFYDLGYYQKALDKYVEAQELYDSPDVTVKIKQCREKVDSDLEVYYEKKAKAYEFVRDFRSALSYYKQAQDKNYTETRRVKIEEITARISNYDKNYNLGKDALAKKKYLQSIGLFRNSLNYIKEDEALVQLEFSRFLYSLYRQDSLLGRRRLEEAGTELLKTTRLLKDSFNYANDNDPYERNTSCLIQQAFENYGNAYSYMQFSELAAGKNLVKTSELKTKLSEKLLGDLVEVFEWIEDDYDRYCDSQQALYYSYIPKNGFTDYGFLQFDNGRALTNLVVKPAVEKSKNKITAVELEYFEEILFNILQHAGNPFFETDAVLPRLDTVMMAMNVYLTSLVSNDLRDSAVHKWIFYDTLYTMAANASFLNNMSRSWYNSQMEEQLYSSNGDYNKYMDLKKKRDALHGGIFDLKGYKEFIEILDLLAQKKQKVEFEIGVPYVLGQMHANDYGQYMATYTTNGFPGSFSESGTAKRKVSYGSPQRAVQAAMVIHGGLKLGKKALPLDWTFRADWLQNKDGSGSFEESQFRAMGSSTPGGTITGRTIASSGTNGISVFIAGLQPSLTLYKYVAVVAGVNFVNTNYNSQFSCPTCDAASRNQIKQVKPMIGVDLNTGKLLGRKYQAFVSMYNYSPLFHTAQDQMSMLPEKERHGTGLFTMDPASYRLRVGLKTYWQNWGASLVFDKLTSRFQYSNSVPPFTTSIFNGVNWQLLSLTVNKKI
ncbi:MAG: hypothetical protein JNL57_11860 [Bacteroidetes bacterium]|nr:hypothetical protein [Bacteroidota bacterium]